MKNILAQRNNIEKAVRLLVQNLGNDEELGKPVLTHSLQVGFKLLSSGCDEAIVLAGFLHDIVEDTKITHEELAREFGESVASIVSLCTKNRDLSDAVERRCDVIKRAASRKESAIVKSADILDNYAYYTAINDRNGIDYCINNAKFMKEFLDENINDPILDELFRILE